MVGQYTVKKRFAIFPPPAGMSLTKLSLDGNNLYYIYSRPGTVWSVTSRLGTGKSVTYIYSVPLKILVKKTTGLSISLSTKDSRIFCIRENSRKVTQNVWLPPLHLGAIGQPRKTTSLCDPLLDVNCFFQVLFWPFSLLQDCTSYLSYF
jgi:hypothetical protein